MVVSQLQESPSSTTRVRRIALVGNPNTGKTSLFNGLTGMNQKIGNYPGVTVEKKTGFFEAGGHAIELIDLPGTYSLAARSLDEAVVTEILFGDFEGERPVELVIAIVDASNLTRNLYLASQIMELGIPVVIALNMVDLAENRGYKVDPGIMENTLDVPVVPIGAHKRIGLDRLRERIAGILTAGGGISQATPKIPDAIAHAMQELREWVNQKQFQIDDAELYRALVDEKGYIEDFLTKRWGTEFHDALTQIREKNGRIGFSSLEAQSRYCWIAHLLRLCVHKPKRPTKTKSDTVDWYLTHNLFGIAIFGVVMSIIFQAIYSWSGPFMDAIELTFGYLGNLTLQFLPPGALQSLVVDGMIGGVGAILVFLPQIAILFLFIALLEDCGYLPRAAYLMDRLFSFCGLSGKSCIPLLSSFACAVPGIMATRTIENYRDRLVTILVAPLMSCSARLPVYLIFIAAFIPDRQLMGGWINLQGLVLFVFYLLGIVVAIPIAWLAKLYFSQDKQSFFILELPSYKMPSIRNALYHVYEQSREFVVRAGTIIFCVSVIVWALAYFPHSPAVEDKYDRQRADLRQEAHGELASLLLELDAERYDAALGMSALEQKMMLDPRLNATEGNAQAETAADATVQEITSFYSSYQDRMAAISNKEQGEYLRTSYLGRMGRWIEPAVAPLGWDWRIGMAVIASLPAREIVIASLGTILNVGDEENVESNSLRNALKTAKREDGGLLFSLPVAFSIMVFFALCCQCAATLAAIRRETHTWKWPVVVFSYMTVLAYLGSFVVYHLTKGLGL